MDESGSAGGGPQAGRREWIGLAVLVLPTLLVALDIGVLYLALPHLSADLGTSSVQQLWITDIYGFLMAGFLITMGSLGDRMGRRRLLLIGAAAFAGASALAAYSTSPGELIGARALLGIAGATLMPCALGLIGNMFRNERQRNTAIAILYTGLMVGSALGPVVGGLLLEHYWWGSVFLLGVPVMVLLLIVGPLLLPEFRGSRTARLDLVSVALSLAAILPVVYGMKELGTGSASTPAVPVVAIVVGLGFGYVFVRRQLTLSSPLLDLGLFGNRSVSTVLGAMLLTGAAMAGMGLLVSQYLQTVLGLSPEQAGLWFAPMGLGLAVSSSLVPLITKVLDPRAAIVSGLLFSTVGFLLLTQVSATGGRTLATLGVAIIAFGDGPLLALGVGIVLGATPPERAGSAASLSETSINFGGTMGMATLGTVGLAVYRHQMTGSIPAAVPAPAAQSARQTVAGAAAAAQHLPPGQAADLMHAARTAFADGLNLAAAIGAGVFLALVVLVAVVLRSPRAAAAAGSAVAETGSGTQVAAGANVADGAALD